MYHQSTSEARAKVLQTLEVQGHMPSCSGSTDPCSCIAQGSESANSLTSASQARTRRKPLADIFPTAKSEPALRKDSGSLDQEPSEHVSALHAKGHAAGQERTALRDKPSLAPSGPPDDDYTLGGMCDPGDDDMEVQCLNDKSLQSWVC